jgi:hypothetical protein
LLDVNNVFGKWLGKLGISVIAMPGL